MLVARIYRGGDGLIAGEALMSAVIFAEDQIGIDCNCTVTKIQRKQLIGQTEKILVGICKCGNDLFIQQVSADQISAVPLCHVHTHMLLRRDTIQTRCSKLFAVRAEIAEIRQNRKSRWFETPTPLPPSLR